jgi:PAS domain S-box-containing protein
MVLHTLLALGVFAADLALPLGVIDGIAYVPVVLVSLGSSLRWYTYTVAFACSGLAILGFFASPPGNPVLWMVVLNRLFALFAIWTTAILGRWYQRVEASRHEGDVRLRAIIETAVDGIITIDPDGIIESFNAAAERLFGYTAAEAIGRNVSLLMPTPYREEHDGYLAQYLHTGEQKIIGIGREVVGQRKDGTVFPLALAVSEMRLGTRRMFTGIIHDITARKQAEDALRQAHDELERRVQERTAELEAANEEVKRFAYIVSHDLRAPLVNIKGFAAELHTACVTVQEVAQAVVPYLEARQRADLTLALERDVPEALAFIDASATRMDTLIQALLQLSRLGRRELDIELIAMDALVKEVLQAIEYQMAQRHVRVSVVDLPPVTADRTAMEQIFSNLLSNAINYLMAGRPGEVVITAARHPESTTFHVQDNGRGIAAEDVPKVFEPFRRVGKQDVAGEGMGLAYVQALVRRHGGTVWCRSTLGVGTTFSFTIAHDLAQGEPHA